MGTSALYACSLLVALGAGPDRTPTVGPAPPRPGGDLGAEDARYLDWLVEDFLFDPRHATYVRVTVPAEAGWMPGLREFTPADGETRDGWLVRGTNGEPDRVYFADGEWVPAVRTRDLNFEALGAARYDDRSSTRSPSNDAADLRIAVRRFGQLGMIGRARESDLVFAAWLHRRGYDGLAARALAAARDGTDDPLDDLRQALARQAADDTVRAFAARADE